MFGLLYNLYSHVRKKTERKLTLVALGLDNAGKTTLINTLNGELDKEVSPTFGFQSASLTEGKYKVRPLTQPEVHEEGYKFGEDGGLTWLAEYRQCSRAAGRSTRSCA